MTLTSGSIKGKQLNLCRGNIIFCHVDSFCLQEKKRKMKEKYFLIPILRRPPQQKSYFIADEARDFPCVAVLTGNSKSTPPCFDPPWLGAGVVIIR